MENKVLGTREGKIQVDYGTNENNNNNHLTEFLYKLSPILTLVSYRSNHKGAKNINVKNRDEEGDKDFIKAREVREDQESNEDTTHSGMLWGLLWNPISILKCG